MFAHNPELKDIFNMSNQRNGDQRQALFDAICAYAANIENLAALLPAVERIAQKHTSFNIQPEQYNIVGGHLLATLDEMFSPGQGSPGRLGRPTACWPTYLSSVKNRFISRVKPTTAAGAICAFRILKKQPQSDVICSFVLAPVDGGRVADFKPGQYLAVYIKHDSLEHQEIRQYSLTTSPNGEVLPHRGEARRSGKVSNHLHQQAREGDVIYIAQPHGDFFLDVSADHAGGADLRRRRPNPDARHVSTPCRQPASGAGPLAASRRKNGGVPPLPMKWRILPGACRI